MFHILTRDPSFSIPDRQEGKIQLRGHGRRHRRGSDAGVSKAPTRPRWGSAWRTARSRCSSMLAARGSGRQWWCPCSTVMGSELERHREAEGVEGRWRRVNEGVVSPSGCPKREMEQQQRCSNGGARSGAWRPRRHFIEHVARVGVGKVGGDFGLVPGRI